MAQRKLWNMQMVIAWAFALVVNEVAYKFVPCMRPGKKVIATGTCEWCGTEHKLFVFVSQDKRHFLGICKACRKHEIRPAGSKTDGRCIARKSDGSQCSYKAKDERGLCGVHSRMKSVAVTNPDGSGSIAGQFPGV